jgi:hypothetical protein
MTDVLERSSRPMRKCMNKMNLINAFLPGMEKSKATKDLFFLLLFGFIVFIISSYYNLLESFVAYSRRHESWDLDELVITLSALFVASFFYSGRRLQESIVSQKNLKFRNAELEKALAEIRQLRGILPICASCKKIRDDTGYWHQVEAYLLKHSEVEFSHGICPGCLKKLYPDYFKDGQPQNDSVPCG